MNRKRLALSAFVVGAIAAAFLLYAAGTWSELFSQYEFLQKNETLIDADAQLIMEHAAEPGTCANRYQGMLLRHGPDACDAKWLSEDKINAASNRNSKIVAVGMMAVAIAAVFVGAALTAILGYFSPALSRLAILVFGRWIPSIVMAYIHWIREPEAKR